MDELYGAIINVHIFIDRSNNIVSAIIIQNSVSEQKYNYIVTFFSVNLNALYSVRNSKICASCVGCAWKYSYP
jgi:hypothetical protein